MKTDQQEFVDALRAVLRLGPLYGEGHQLASIGTFEPRAYSIGFDVPRSALRSESVRYDHLHEHHDKGANAARPRLNREGGKL